MFKILKNKKGISLIEVLIALALLGVIAIAFIGAIYVGLGSVAIADERATAESLARTQIEHVKQQPYRDADPSDVATYSARDVSADKAYDYYSVESYDREGGIAPIGTIVVIPWNSESDDEVPVDAGLQKISLTIFHDDKAVLTLEGYKVDEGVY
jgi:prepilin-type N-terminal cleavage/methylation domain-containing protein